MKLKNPIGFTLIEVLVVIGISVILIAAGISIYGKLQISTQLNETTSQIIQTLRMARGRSVAGLHNTTHGVYFAGDRYTLYQGPTFATRDNNYDRVIVLDGPLSLSTTLTGNEVNFSKGFGIPNTTGNITLTYDVSGTALITINSIGMVEKN